MKRKWPWAVRVALALLASVGVVVASAGWGSSFGGAIGTSGARGAGMVSSESGIAQAKAIVAKYSKEQPALRIPALPKAAPKKTIAWVYCTLPTCQAGAAQRAFTALGWNFKLVAWNEAQAPASFLQAFDNALAMNPKPDFIGVPQLFPASVDATQLAQAKAEGIPVIDVTSTTGVGGPVIACMSCAPSLVETARLQVATALADAGHKTSIVYGYDPTLLVFAQEFLPAAEAEVKELSPQSTFSTLQLSLAAPPSQNTSAVVNYLQRNPGVKYVLLAASELGAGLPQALSAAGLSGKVKFITQAPQPTDLQEIKDGQEFASVGADDAVSMWRAANALAWYAITGHIPHDLIEPAGWHEIVTKATVAQAAAQSVQPQNYQAIFKRAWGVGH